MKFSKYFDHTILMPEASFAQVEKICKEAIQNEFASVCVNSYRTKMVAELLAGTEVKTCVVVGFPLGAQPSSVKAFEALEALKNGADEIDMVVNIGAVKDGNWDEVEEDIRNVKKACGDKTLKVILETCLLTMEEKEKACKVVVAAGGDFVKTSTGFSKKGAEKEDVLLFKEILRGTGKIKASGGIRSYEKAREMIESGADRLGTSATLHIIQNREDLNF